MTLLVTTTTTTTTNYYYYYHYNYHYHYHYYYYCHHYHYHYYFHCCSWYCDFLIFYQTLSHPVRSREAGWDQKQKHFRRPSQRRPWVDFEAHRPTGQQAHRPIGPQDHTVQSWALSVFFNFSIIRNDFIAFYIKSITYFCTSPILKANSQSNKLDKKYKKSFYRYRWRNWLTRTADIIRGRSTAVLFNIWKLVWSSYLLKNYSQIERKFK